MKCQKMKIFFLILEANIPLFRGENAKFGNFFEFLDLPGLDEGKDDSTSFKSSNFFKKNILPKIVCNSLFSILIFDAQKYMRKILSYLETILKPIFRKIMIIHFLF